MASRIFDGHVRERTAPVVRASRSLTTCCVIVDPPSLTRPVTRLRHAARATAIGSTPGWRRNRASSAAIVAAVSGSGNEAASIRALRIPVPERDS